MVLQFLPLSHLWSSLYHSPFSPQCQNPLGWTLRCSLDIKAGQAGSHLEQVLQDKVYQAAVKHQRYIYANVKSLWFLQTVVFIGVN